MWGFEYTCECACACVGGFLTSRFVGRWSAIRGICRGRGGGEERGLG